MLRIIPIVLLSFIFYEFSYYWYQIRSVACTGALLGVSHLDSNFYFVIEKLSASFIVAQSDPLPAKHLVEGLSVRDYCSTATKCIIKITD